MCVRTCACVCVCVLCGSALVLTEIQSHRVSTLGGGGGGGGGGSWGGVLSV